MSGSRAEKAPKKPFLPQRAPSVKNALVLGGEPRVQLLPPEVGARIRAAYLRRVSVLVLALAVVVVGGGYLLATLHADKQEADLAAAQAETQALLAEQLEYSEASLSSNMIATITAARAQNVVTEVLWSDVIAAIKASLPSGVIIESATMVGRAPWEPELEPAGPLRQPRVATIEFVISSPTIFDATAIVRGLVNVPGFADATPDTVSAEAGLFSTTVTLNINDLALSGRFGTEEPATDTTEETTP